MTDKKAKAPSVLNDQKGESPDANEFSGNRENNVNPQITELYSELFKSMRESVTIEETDTLEGQTIAIIRDSRGQLFLILKNNEGGFERLGEDYANDIPEVSVYSTFNWLKDKKIKDFISVSGYLKQVAENKSKTN